MTDLLTENARLRAALEAAKRDTALALAQVDRLLTLTTTLATERDDSREYAVALEAELKARAALATPAPDAVQEAARVERVACAMWKAEADRAAPNVGRNRTPEMFANELHDTRAKWLGLADAALRAIAGDRT